MLKCFNQVTPILKYNNYDVCLKKKDYLISLLSGIFHIYQDFNLFRQNVIFHNKFAQNDKKNRINLDLDLHFYVIHVV